MRTGNIFLIFLIALLACSNPEQTKFNLLQDGEAFASFQVSGSEFYSDTTLFKGTVFIYNESFTINLFGNDQSNIMLTLPKSANLDVPKPRKIKISAKNQLESDLMFGKIDGAASGKGIGYIITEGEANLVQFDSTKILIKYKGKCSEINNYMDETKWENLQGFLTIKKPDIKQ